MGYHTVKKFKTALQRANGDKRKMKEVFKSINDYLESSVSEKKPRQKLGDYLSNHPEVKHVHEWSDTVLVDNSYELVNY